MEADVEDHLLRRVADFADAERATWVQAAACRIVAALFDAGNVAACRVPVGPLSDLEFADALACCELELIAAGDDPVRILLQMAVMRTARDALRVCAAIDALPEASSREQSLSARRGGNQTRFRGCYRRDGLRSACHRRTYPP